MLRIQAKSSANCNIVLAEDFGRHSLNRTEKTIPKYLAIEKIKY